MIIKMAMPEGFLPLHDQNIGEASIHTSYRIPALLLLWAIEDGRITGKKFGTGPIDYFVDPVEVIAILGHERCQTLHVLHDSDHKILYAMNSCNPPSRDYTRAVIQIGGYASERRLKNTHILHLVSTVCPRDDLNGAVLSREEAIQFIEGRDYIKNMPELQWAGVSG